MAPFPAPEAGILLTHFLESADIPRARRFYTDVLGGEVVLDGDPTIVSLANGWIIINAGGPPTDDKPTVTLTTPSPDTTSSFLNIRVADIRKVYEELHFDRSGLPSADRRAPAPEPGAPGDRNRGEGIARAGEIAAAQSRHCTRRSRGAPEDESNHEDCEGRASGVIAS